MRITVRTATFKSKVRKNRDKMIPRKWYGARKADRIALYERESSVVTQNYDMYKTTDSGSDNKGCR